MDIYNNTENLFETTTGTENTNYDTTPIVMIDHSGSTSSWFMRNEKQVGSYYRDGKNIDKTVFYMELLKVKEILSKRNIEEFNIVFWDNRTTIPEEQPFNFDKLLNFTVQLRSGTYIAQALKRIPTEWLENKRDIYIVTDGEICDGSDFSNYLGNLSKHNIYIMTVERSHESYLEGGLNAGGRIYGAIRDSNMTDMVKQFICFNNIHFDEPFINMENPDVPEGYLPYKGRIFKKENLYHFIRYIKSEIDNILSTSSNPSNSLLGIVYYLTNTIHNLVDGEGYLIKDDTFRIFTELFKNTPIYDQVYDIISGEIKNIKKGRTSTFQDYKRQRNRYFENTQMNLFEDTKNNLSHKKNQSYLSFPVNTTEGLVVFEVDNKTVDKNIFIKTDNYKESCFEYRGNNIPVLPLNMAVSNYEKIDFTYIPPKKPKYTPVNDDNSFAVLYESSDDEEDDVNVVKKRTFTTTYYDSDYSDEDDDDDESDDEPEPNKSNLINYSDPFISSIVDKSRSASDIESYNQALRQWIRIIYGARYNINNASDRIMYLFLADTFNVLVSGLPDHIKDAYRRMSIVFLNRFRFGTEDKELTWLTKNCPKTTTKYDGNINDMLNHCLRHLELNVEPLTLWYGIISTIEPRLAQKQLEFCKNSITKDGFTPENVVSELASKMKNIYYHSSVKKLGYTYKCYITLEDTNETGGYIIPPHEVTSNVVCSPRFVISEEGHNMLCSRPEFTCPICYKTMSTSELLQIPSESEYNKEQGTIEYTVTGDEFKKGNHAIIKIPEILYRGIPDYNLVELDDYNFNRPMSYQIDEPHIKQLLGNYNIAIDNQEDFNNYTFERFKFLENLKMKDYDAYLAGGFCRSVLLKQKLKDLDIFFTGDKYEENFTRLLPDLLTEIKNYYNSKGCSIKFVYAYKPLFNVFEVDVVSDPKDFFDENYNLDNFKQYDFKSLHKFDKYIVIDPKTGTVYRKDTKYSKLKKIDNKTLTEEKAKELGLESTDFSNYFEDGDVHGIRILQRVQFILYQFGNVQDIFKRFDMYPSMVAWDGEKTVFSEEGAFAFKYMINVVNENFYSTLYGHRLGKYFTYGFSPVLPLLDIKKLNNYSTITFDETRFKVRMILDNQIICETNSHMQDKISSIESLEKKNAKEGNSLYKSSLFCSFVSLLRYIKIENIPYKFTGNILTLDDDKSFTFITSKEQVKFIDNINSRVPGHDLYKSLRKN